MSYCICLIDVEHRTRTGRGAWIMIGRKNCHTCYPCDEMKSTALCSDASKPLNGPTNLSHFFLGFSAISTFVCGLSTVAKPEARQVDVTCPLRSVRIMRARNTRSKKDPRIRTGFFQTL